MLYEFKGFTEKANRALNDAISQAEMLGSEYVGSEHILLGILKEEDCVGAVVLRQMGVTFGQVQEAIKREKNAQEGAVRMTPADLTPRSRRILQIAAAQAVRFGSSFVGTEHILFALLNEKDSYAIHLLEGMGVRPVEAAEEIIRIAARVPSVMGSGNRADTAGEKDQKKILQQFATDLTKEAREGKLDPVIGREKETERVIQILSRRTKNNPVLIGEPGVGKTAVVEGLAQRIAGDQVPDTLKGKRIFSLDLSGMLAGTKYRGDFEGRMKRLTDEMKNEKNGILFIDELHTIIGAGASEGSSDAANILKPYLVRGDFQVIGATTVTEYRKHIEKDAALERRFQTVQVGEPSEEETVAILQGLRDRYEVHHKVRITDEAIRQAVHLSRRYIPDRFLPDKAIDLIDEAASRVHLHGEAVPASIGELEEEIGSLEQEKDDAVQRQDFERAAALRDRQRLKREELDQAKADWKERAPGSVREVGIGDISAVVSMWTGIPVSQISMEEGQRLLNLENLLHERLVGQEEAVSAVSRAIRRGRVGLKDPNRPTGSFLFLGPTGVGKTELCKALAQALFGSEDAMIRFDMSEYMEKHTVSRLVGSPPGYVGYEEGGQLTEAIRRRPYSVLLFDEIEKAHPDLFNILLQILDDGTITDAQGRKVDCRNTIVILTSNIGARRLTDTRPAMGFAGGSSPADAVQKAVMEEVKKLFRPELLNRIDEKVIFHSLTVEETRMIAKRLIQKLRDRLTDLGYTVQFSEEVYGYITEKGYDSVYGARPLRRTIQNILEDGLSTAILEERMQPGRSYLCTLDGEGNLSLTGQEEENRV